MAWIVPKLDWLSTDKINFADWNRIENNAQFVASYLNSIGYTIPAITVNVARDNTSIDKLSSINRIEQNLESIRTNFITPIGYPGTRAWTVTSLFDFNDAIRLESDVNQLYNLGILVFQSFVYCGTQKSGAQELIW